MADIFVWSGATGLNDGTKWEDAFVVIGRDYGPLLTPATDFVYVRDSHAESHTNLINIIGSTAEGTTAPVRIITVVGNDTGTTPGNLSTGAGVTIASGSADMDIGENVYIYGIDFIVADDFLLGNNGIGDVTLEQCRLEITGTGGDDFFFNSNGATPGVVRLIDCDLDVANTGSNINLYGGVLIWDGGTFEGTVSGNALIVNGNNLRKAEVHFRNLDLSVISGAILGNSNNIFVHLDRCVMHASVTLQDASIDNPHAGILVTHCQDGTDTDPSFQMFKGDYKGSTQVDTARYRTGGASDGERTNPVSWDMETGTLGGDVIETYAALESPPISAWTDGDGSTAVVFRVHVASGGTLNDDDLWIDITGPSSTATNSQGERTTTRMAPLGTPTALTTDSGSTWTGTDVGTKQYVQVSYTPDKPGPVTCRVYLAQPSQRVSVDPVIVIDP